jgi:hypothetical protein
VNVRVRRATEPPTRSPSTPDTHHTNTPRPRSSSSGTTNPDAPQQTQPLRRKAKPATPYTAGTNTPFGHGPSPDTPPHRHQRHRPAPPPATPYTTGTGTATDAARTSRTSRPWPAQEPTRRRPPRQQPQPHSIAPAPARSGNHDRTPPSTPATRRGSTSAGTSCGSRSTALATTTPHGHDPETVTGK